MRVPILLLAVCCTAAVAWATPSTLVWIPSVDIQAPGTWHLGVDNYFTPTDGTRSPTDVGVTYGFANGRAEAGIDYFGGQDDPFFFNAKVLVTPETARIPAVAVGVYNLGTESDVTDYNMIYGLVAKTFGGARLTAGYCHGNEGALGMDPDMLLLGLDGYLSRDKKWWGAVDYQSGTNAFGALSFGVSYAVAPNVSLLVGYDIYNAAAVDGTITTQLDINF
ncbi:MAG: hypothetical protein KKI08_19810 [Armatimonadetes bacterium]|nr:hypothetical protein [Armatimonadota bacterium]